LFVLLASSESCLIKEDQLEEQENKIHFYLDHLALDTSATGSTYLLNKSATLAVCSTPHMSFNPLSQF